eukprot:5757796-Pyramimonas_sp.AAC.1
MPLEDPKPPVAPDKVRSVLGKFKKHTAVGVCNWAPHALKQLCTSGMLALSVLMYLRDTDSQLPEQIALLVLPFLQEPEGGRRPIGIISTPARLYSRLRHDEAERWEDKHARTHMYGGKGKSCEMAIWKKA